MLNNKIIGENFLNTMNLSIEYLKKALENAQFILSKKPRSEEAKKIKADALLNISNAYLVLGKFDKNYNKALRKAEEALKYSKEINYLISEGKCFNLFGNIYFQIKDHKNAEMYFLKDVQICKQVGDFQNLVQSYI